MATQAGAPNESLTLRDIPAKARDDAKASDFAGKNRSYPILKSTDVAAALKSIGRAGADNYPADELKRRILRIAKRKGFPIPKSDQGDTKSTSIHLPPTVIHLADGDAGDGPATTWIQVLRVGKFWSPRYKDFSVTKATLRKMVENFETVTPKAPTELPLDYNHGTNRPDTIEQGTAAGWIKSLELREDDTELWAHVSLTEKAATLVRNEEYRFVSATFEFDHVHTDGENREKKIGPTLMAAALTNTPFVEGMAPVTLDKQDAVALAEDDEAVEDSFSYDEQRRRINDALCTAFGDLSGCGCYLVDLFDGRAIYREGYGGDLFEVSYRIDAAGDVTFTDLPAEVVAEYRRLATGTGATEMATIKVKDAKGNEIELAEDTVKELAKQHAPKPAAGSVDLTQRLDDLEVNLTKAQTEITELSAKNLALETEKKELNAKAKVDALIRAGKIEPKSREKWTKLALADRDTFKALTDDLPIIRTYGHGDGTSDDVEQMSASDEVTALAKQLCEKDSKLSLTDATTLVFAKNPQLYERYKIEAAIKV